MSQSSSPSLMTVKRDAPTLLPEPSAQNLITTRKFPVIYFNIEAAEKPAAWLRSCRKHLLSSLSGTKTVTQVQ